MDFRVVDISEGGLLVETRIGLPPATTCELRLESQALEIIIKAKVRRCRAQLTKTDGGCKVAYRSGLEFVNLDTEMESTVREIITERCNGTVIAEATMGTTAGEIVTNSSYTV